MLNFMGRGYNGDDIFSDELLQLKMALFQKGKK